MREYEKKVAIMTWYTYRNFGSALQATALSHVIEQLGYMPSFIKYYPTARNEEPSRITLRWFLKKVTKKVHYLRNRVIVSNERERLFEKYLDERIHETQLCRSYPELHALNEEYDAFVCGSDQIWSPLCYDDKYFLSFVSNPDKMVAYAPSLGSTEIKNPIIRERIIGHISRFHHLAVREQQGASLIQSLTGKTANVVLDPTLLMNASEWNLFARVDETEIMADKEYIICYFMGDADQYMSYVRRLSETMRIPFYLIPVTARQNNGGNAVPFEIGPSEFVSLIRNAKYVCTDSFHGMAFAINYNVPFDVFKRFTDHDPQNQNSRILSLLKLLNLETRLVDYSDTQNRGNRLVFDYTEANNLLEEQRRQSAAYLKQALAEAVEAYGETNENGTYKITDMCCGCGACAAVCPKGAITISRDDNGFEQYAIDQSKCVRCGMCKTVCPMTKPIALDMKDSLALYSAKSKSEQVLSISSSGGVGFELAKLSQNQGRYICGCAYDSADNAAKHVVIAPEEPEKLSLLQSSKYIQSVSAGAMKQIAELAKTNLIVFFGTPCQAAAADKLLRKKGYRGNAVLVDLICHGVPSYLLWEKYLRDLDQEHGTGSNPTVMFRSKEREWRRRLLLVSGNGHTYKKEEHKDDFYAFFRRGLCYLESCSDCPYRERSAADLRIGDYWGPRFDKDKQGVSMVVVNTSSGQSMLEILDKQGICNVQKQQLSEYWTVQYPYNPLRPLIREQLIMDLKDENKIMHELRKAYCTYHDQIEEVRKMKAKVKKVLKRG